MNTAFFRPIALLVFSLFSFHILHATQLTGTVQQATTGNPVADVKVTVDQNTLSATTDVQGQFELKLDPGIYTLRFSKAGFLTTTREGVKVGKEKQDITVTLWQIEAAEEQVMVQDAIRTKAEYTTNADRVMKVGYGTPPVPAPQSLNYSNGYVNDSGNWANFNTEEYDFIAEIGFRKSLGNPLSTFSIDVDGASYSNIRRFISQQQAPPKDAVRIEELVNYFSYNYRQPTGDAPFSIYTEVSECPWNADNKLVHIGLQGKKLEADETTRSNLVFLIDVSGSMNQPNKLPLVKSSLKKLLDGLHEDDRIALVVYAGSARVVLGSTPVADKQRIISAIDQLQAGGSTAGGDGIKLAYDVAANNFMEEGNNRVILATDGDFNTGPSSDAEMVRLIEDRRKTGVYITILGFGMGNYKDSKMEQISAHGNGNYFYIDREPEADKVFGQELTGTLYTIAQDVKIQVEFNPAYVESYRLIGYENRMLNKEDFEDDTKDAGELGAGHTVTALYEIVPVKTAWAHAGEAEDSGTRQVQPDDDLKYQTSTVRSDALTNGEVMTVKLRYKDPGGSKSKMLERSVAANNHTLEQSSEDFRWSASVAMFGMLLRDSEFKGSGTFDQVIQLAQGATGKDPFGHRTEFIDMARYFTAFFATK